MSLNKNNKISAKYIATGKDELLTLGISPPDFRTSAAMLITPQVLSLDNWTAGQLDTFIWLFHFWGIFLIFVGDAGAGARRI